MKKEKSFPSWETTLGNYDCEFLSWCLSSVPASLGTFTRAVSDIQILSLTLVFIKSGSKSKN